MPALSYTNLLPKEPGFAHNAPSQEVGQEQRGAASRRKKTKARDLAPGENIFHNYSWSAPEDTRDGPGPKTPGRRPYDWTPRRSRELIKLIIHTDLKFDDIATAMKDENGEGPCEFTCRNHWHDIFGYRPDLARLKNREGRERRHTEHVEKFEAYKKNSGAKSEAELREDEEASPGNQVEFEPSEPASSNSSVRNNSFVPSEESPHNDFAYQDASSFFPLMEPSGFTSSSMHPGNGGLAPVTEEDDNEDVAPDQKVSPAATSGAASRAPGRSRVQDRRVTKVGEKSAAQIEDKEGLPTGFLTAFKRLSFASSFASSIYAGSRNSSRTSLAIPTGNAPPPAGLFSYVSQKAVPKHAICSYLDNCSAVTNVPTDHIEELIQRGADINACNRKGETPLHLAVKLGNIVVFSFLITKGANPDAKTRNGESIWKYGGKASKAILPPDKVYENKGKQLLDTMVCAHIEFLRATAKYNPDLITDDAGNKGKKRRASDDSIDHYKIQQRYRRSGAIGISEKRSGLSEKLSMSWEEDQDFLSRLEQVSNALNTPQEGLGMAWNDPNFTSPFNPTPQDFGSGTHDEVLDPAVPTQGSNINYDGTTLMGHDNSFNVNLSYDSQGLDNIGWPQETAEQTGINAMNNNNTEFIGDYTWQPPKAEEHVAYNSAYAAAATPEATQIPTQYTATTPVADYSQAWPSTTQPSHYNTTSAPTSDPSFPRQDVSRMYQQPNQSNLYQQLHQNSTTQNHMEPSMPYQTPQQTREEIEIASVEREFQEATARSRTLMDKLNFLKAKASLRRNVPPPPTSHSNGGLFHPSSWGSGSGG